MSESNFSSRGQWPTQGTGWLPDYLVLLSTLGGIAVFGINGFVLGPMIAALFITIWDIASAPRAGRRLVGSELGRGAE